MTPTNQENPQEGGLRQMSPGPVGGPRFYETRMVNHYFCMNGPYEGCLATVVGNHSQGRVLLCDQKEGNVKVAYELLDGRLWWDE